MNHFRPTGFIHRRSIDRVMLSLSDVTDKQTSWLVNVTFDWRQMDRVKRIWYLSPMRAAKVQASLRIRAVSPEPPLLAHISSGSRGPFRQKARSLASLNGWACAVKTCRDGMLEHTNSLDGAQIMTTAVQRYGRTHCLITFLRCVFCTVNTEYSQLSYNVAVIQWITSCHKNRMTTRYITLGSWRVTSWCYPWQRCFLLK